MIQKILNKKVLAAAVALTAASGFFFFPEQCTFSSPLQFMLSPLYSSFLISQNWSRKMVRQSSALTLPKQCQRDRILHWTEFQKINSIS